MGNQVSMPKCTYEEWKIMKSEKYKSKTKSKTKLNKITDDLFIEKVMSSYFVTVTHLLDVIEGDKLSNYTVVVKTKDNKGMVNIFYDIRDIIGKDVVIKKILDDYIPSDLIQLIIKDGNWIKEQQIKQTINFRDSGINLNEINYMNELVNFDTQKLKAICFKYDIPIDNRLDISVLGKVIDIKRVNDKFIITLLHNGLTKRYYFDNDFTITTSASKIVDGPSPTYLEKSSINKVSSREG